MCTKVKINKILAYKVFSQIFIFLLIDSKHLYWVQIDDDRVHFSFYTFNLETNGPVRKLSTVSSQAPGTQMEQDRDIRNAAPIHFGKYTWLDALILGGK